MIHTNSLRSFILILTFIVIFTPSCFTQQPSEISTISSGDAEEPVSKLETDILAYINKYRQSKGLTQLITDPIIAAQAERHSINMAAKKVAFSHDGFEQRVSLITQKLGVLKLSAENVAYGKINAKQVVDIWLKSPGHLKNIEGKFQLTGIGVSTARDGTIFFTQIFAAKQ